MGIVDGVEIPPITVQPKLAANLLSELALALRTARRVVQVQQARVRMGNAEPLSVHVLRTSVALLLDFVESAQVKTVSRLNFNLIFAKHFEQHTATHQIVNSTMVPLATPTRFLQESTPHLFRETRSDPSCTVQLVYTIVQMRVIWR